jgi:hypothetical protein
VAAEGEEARLVALDQRLESRLLTLAGQGYELLVALEPEQGRLSGQCRQGGTML